ncbi:TPA: hypothetical protein ACH3X1_009551 [Trebouxia sp. C0004]
MRLRDMVRAETCTVQGITIRGKDEVLALLSSPVPEMLRMQSMVWIGLSWTARRFQSFSPCKGAKGLKTTEVVVVAALEGADGVAVVMVVVVVVEEVMVVEVATGVVEVMTGPVTDAAATVPPPDVAEATVAVAHPLPDSVAIAGLLPGQHPDPGAQHTAAAGPHPAVYHHLALVLPGGTDADFSSTDEQQHCEAVQAHKRCVFSVLGDEEAMEGISHQTVVA